MLVYCILIFLYGSGTFADALRGYELMYQFESGEVFNTFNYRFSDRLYSFFVAWWSPAQWLIPYLLRLAFNIEIQTIQFLLISISTIAGLSGYYKLFEKFRFSKTLILASILCIVSNQLFYWHFILFYGGDLFVFAALPWFLLFVLKTRDNFSFLNLLLLTLISLSGAFLKNTFLILVACALIFLFFTLPRRNLKTVIKLSIVGILVLAADYFFLLQHGETPGSATDLEGLPGIEKNISGDIFFSLGSPLGIFSRFSPFILKTSGFWYSSGIQISLLQILPFAGTFLFLFIYSRQGEQLYLKLLYFFALPFFLVFTILLLQDRAVSYEMRHYAPVAFLFFPGFCHSIVSIRSKSLKYILLFFVIFVNAGDFALFPVKFSKFHQDYENWSGLKFIKSEAEELKIIAEWDKNTKNGIFIVESEWNKVFGVKNNHKIVTEKLHGEWIVVSGMELDEPPMITFGRSLPDHYSEILVLVGNKDSELLEELSFLDMEQYKQSEGAYFYRWKE